MTGLEACLRKNILSVGKPVEDIIQKATARIKGHCRFCLKRIEGDHGSRRRRTPLFEGIL
jgi:hypothetical protein